MFLSLIHISKPLVVGSCGNYRVLSHPKMPTYRPRGRLDYQIIYIASGKAHFHFDNAENETIIPAGNMVLYRPCLLYTSNKKHRPALMSVYLAFHIPSQNRAVHFVIIHFHRYPPFCYSSPYISAGIRKGSWRSQHASQ